MDKEDQTNLNTTNVEASSFDEYTICHQGYSNLISFSNVQLMLEKSNNYIANNNEFLCLDN
jgi:hypothetical protein